MTYGEGATIVAVVFGFALIFIGADSLDDYFQRDGERRCMAVYHNPARETPSGYSVEYHDGHCVLAYKPAP